jgi:hypothetical protein
VIRCITCKEDYKQTGREVSCSVPCKLLSGIKKDHNDCWIWQKSKGGPYAKVRYKMKTYSGHKASYEAFVGEVPAGMWVCHKCDNPPCINPDHLFLGSPSDNNLDAIKKGRWPIGEKSHLSKFTDIQTEEIRLLKNEGLTYERLSRIFNCSITHLYNIVKNKQRKIHNGI